MTLDHMIAIAKQVLRFLAHHTGLPVLVVAAIVLVVGWKILRRTTRFVAQVAAISLVLLVLSQLGWIRW